MNQLINISRAYSGGVFNGLFGNPIKEKIVSEQYRTHFRSLIQTNPKECAWLKEQLDNGAVLYCRGCGVNSPTCHARIIEDEIKNYQPTNQTK